MVYPAFLLPSTSIRHQAGRQQNNLVATRRTSLNFGAGKYLILVVYLILTEGGIPYKIAVKKN